MKRMNMLLARSAAVLSLSFSVGCLSLTPAGQRVRITNNVEVVRGCEFLANVKSDAAFGGVNGEHSILIQLQNDTAALGGNVIYLDSRGGGFGGSLRVGEAYRCSPATPIVELPGR
jgi:hypothetical protein